MAVPSHDDEEREQNSGPLDPLTPEIIETINGIPHAVLKASHISMLKRLSKLASDVDLHVQIRNCKVSIISHTIYDLVSPGEA